MATTVTFGSGGIYDAGAHTVYFRKEWGDDWVADSDLQATEIVWSCAPTIPTATLLWRYGSVKQPTANGFVTTVKRLDLRRVFIKVEVVSDTATPFKWVGVLEIADDHMAGARLTTDSDGKVTVGATGQQIFTCYGMAKLLADHEIATSVWGEDVPPETVYTTDKAIEFNHQGIAVGKGNRTAATVSGTYVFEPSPTIGEWWSTKTITEYLLKHQTPKDEDGGLAVEFQLQTGDVLPDWDRPQVEQEHSTTFALLDRLINRKKMLTWWVEVNENGATDICEIATNTLLNIELPLPLSWSKPIPANTNPLHLIYDQDQRTSAVLRDNAVQLVDQVVVTGGYRRSVLTVSWDDGTLDAGWLPADRLSYNAGAAIPIGSSFADADRRHAEFRSQPKLEQVYAHYKLPFDWDMKSKAAGEGLTEEVFIKTDGTKYPKYPREIEIDSILPLLAGVDYEGGAIGSGATGHDSIDTRESLSPLVIFLRPETRDTREPPVVGPTRSGERWILAERIGDSMGVESDDYEAMPRFSCRVRVSDDKRGILVKVTGEPGQHAIVHAAAGSADFFTTVTPPPTGYRVDSRGMLATIAVLDDRKVEARQPEDPLTSQAVRTLYIDAGDGYRQDYIVPNTVVGLEDGKLVRSDGGYLPAISEDDDIHKLDAIAVVAAAYYTKPHAVLTLQTYQPTTDVGLGDLINQIGNTEAAEGDGHRHTINSPVTQLTLTLPDDGSPIVERIDTWAGELDPLHLASVYGADSLKSDDIATVGTIRDFGSGITGPPLTEDGEPYRLHHSNFEGRL